MKAVEAHFEKYLGRAGDGWCDGRTSLHVVPFGEQPTPGATTYASLGLSTHVFSQQSGSTLRQELLFCCYDEFRTLPIENLLFIVGADVIASHTALAHGSVIGSRGPLFDGSKLEALLCLPPTYFPPAFEVVSDIGDGSEVAVVWLIPLYAAEADFATTHGWQRLATLLLEMDPDLLDLKRPPMNLGFS
ncbi:MAG: suppressor of fused domain protein [Vicinamibacteria bacterium]|nr:suppressor of fused domain protein [Vicinamibacteria bacterium]